MLKLIDFSPVVIACAYVNQQGGEFRPDLLRHQVLNSLRYYKTNTPGTENRLVICADSDKYWRKEFFPHYKAMRKKSSFANWPQIDDFRTQLFNELNEFSPYTCIKIEGLEADDIIGVLALNVSEDVLIVSADKDFRQLHSARVQQQHPQSKLISREVNPADFLARQIMRGDVGDGIPNFLSDDDTFINASKRQNPLREKDVERYLQMSPEEFRTTFGGTDAGGYHTRNRILIDLSIVPHTYKATVMEIYEQPERLRHSFYQYLKIHNLNELLEKIGDF